MPNNVLLIEQRYFVLLKIKGKESVVSIIYRAIGQIDSISEKYSSISKKCGFKRKQSSKKITMHNNSYVSMRLRNKVGKGQYELTTPLRSSKLCWFSFESN